MKNNESFAHCMMSIHHSNMAKNYLGMRKSLIRKTFFSRIGKKIALITSMTLVALHANHAISETRQWQHCANEGQTCSVPSKSKVRYGSQGLFHEIQQVNSSIACNNGVFGDPISSIAKVCEYLVASDVSAPIFGKTPNTVTDSAWHKVAYSGINYTPVMIAQMQTQGGADTAGVRMRNLGQNSFEVIIEEEQSKDTELVHAAESVGYIGFKSGDIHDNEGKLIGEAGFITRDQASLQTWYTKNLNHEYSHPIVIMGVSSFKGAQPINMQVKDIENNKFKYRMAEWNYLDGYHTSETMSYIVIEAGSYILESGRQLVAGAVFSDDGFDTKNFPASAKGFSSTPIVLTQQRTVVDDTPYVTRMRNITKDNFDLRVQEEEAANVSHNTEEIAYLAIGNVGFIEQWLVTTKHFGKDITNIDIAEQFYNTIPANYSSVNHLKTTTTTAHVLNFNQTSGRDDGLFPADRPFSRQQGTGNDNFVVKATATIKVEESGNYVFGVRADDGFRLRINGNIVSERVNGGAVTEVLSNSYYMAADTSYFVELTYFDHVGVASLEFYMRNHGESAAENHLVQAGLNLGLDDIVAERSLEEISSNNNFGYNVLRKQDRLVRKPGFSDFGIVSTYLAFNDDGDLVINHEGNEIWSAKTGISDKNEWSGSALHAQQCDSNTATVHGECGSGHELKIDGLGLYVVNENGMVIWRPDLGDLDDTDTSQGYTLKFIPSIINNYRLALVNNATGHIRWDSYRGYIPVRKATTALFTTIHSDASWWQMPHTPETAGTTELGYNNKHEDYVFEEDKQQAILSYHVKDNKSDALMCSDCDPNASVQYKAIMTVVGNLEIVSYDRSTGNNISTLWSSNSGGLSHTDAFLRVTYNGLQIYNRNLSQSLFGNAISWRAVQGLPSSNYMLRLAKGSAAEPELELWDMELNQIVWHTGNQSNNDRRTLWHPHMPQVIKDTVRNVESAGAHLLSDGYNVAKFGWDHLEHFITNSAEWEDFKQLFDDATHFRLHDALSDMVKLEIDATNDAERALYDVGRVLLVIRQLSDPNMLEKLLNAEVFKDLYETLTHPNRLVNYVESVVDSMVEAKYKAEALREIIQNPSDMEEIIVGAVNQALDGGRDHLEEMVMEPIKTMIPDSMINESSQEHGMRHLQRDNSEDASCDDAIDSRFCRFLSENPGFGWDISLPELVANFVSPNKAKFKIFGGGIQTPQGTNWKTLNHIQLRATLLPMTHLRDVNGDDVLDLVKLQLRVQSLQITALMNFRAATGSLAFVGPFTEHSWSFPLLAYDKNGQKLSHTAKNATYTTSTGLAARSDLQFESIKRFLGEMKNLISGQGQTLNNAGTIAGQSTAPLANVANQTQSVLNGVPVQSAPTLASAAASAQSVASSAATPLAQNIGRIYFRFLQLSNNVITTPFMQSSGITLTAATPLRFRYNYQLMTPAEKILLHYSESVGTFAVPFILEYLGVGIYLDSITENPISSVSIESMIGDTLATLIFWAADGAFHDAKGTENPATIHAYFAGSVGLTFSYNKKDPRSTVYIGSRSSDGVLLGKTRLRVRFIYSISTD